MKPIKRFLSLVALVAFVASCADFKEHKVDGRTGTADFTKYVAIGNSITAGYQSNAIFAEGQEMSYAAMIARQAGVQTFNIPFLSPGVGNRIDVQSFTGNPLVPIVTATTALTTTNFPAQPTERFQNLAVPGADIQDYTNITAPRRAANPLFNVVLGAAANFHAYVEPQNPTFATFWLGNNDILGYATSGGLQAFTNPVDFGTRYTTAITQLLGINSDLKVVVGNIPNVTTIAFTTTVGPAAKAGVAAAAAANPSAGIVGLFVQRTFYVANAGINAAENKVAASLIATANIGENVTDGGLILLTAQAILPLLGTSAAPGSPSSSANIAAVQNYWRNFLVTAGLNTLDDVSAFTQTELQDRLKEVTYGQYAQTFSVDLATAATELAGTGFDFDFNRPFGFHPHNPLPNQFVLDKNEINIATAVTGIYNTTISQVVSANATRVGLVNVNSIFNTIVSNSGYQTDGLTLTPTLLSLFSLDGVHPSNRGQAVIANEFIKVINEKFNGNIRRINVASIPVGITLSNGYN